MATTLKQSITSEWQQVSEGDCTIQSETPNSVYEVAVTTEPPTDSFIVMPFDEATTFAYKTPVWLRLQAKGAVSLERAVNIIK